MAITQDEGRTGGKICKQPLRQVPFTPYNRPQSADRGICRPPPANEAVKSRWFAKKLLDSVALLVVKGVSRLFSVFFKDIAATPGENAGAMEEVSQVNSALKKNLDLIPLSIKKKKTVNALVKKRQRKAACDVAESKVPLNLLSNLQPTDPCPIPSSSSVQPTDPYPIPSSLFESSQIVKASEKQKSSYEVREQGGNSLEIRLSIRYDGSDTSRQELISHVHDIFQLEEQLNQKKFSRSEINKKEDLLLSRTTEQSTLKAICEKGFESPIEIAKAYLASKPRMAAPYILNSQKKNASALSLQFGNRLARAQVASRSGSGFPVIPVDSHNNNKMAQESRAKSTLHDLLRWRPPYCRYAMRAKIKGYSPKCKCGDFGHGNALKRGRSDMDEGCAGDARRVRPRWT